MARYGRLRGVGREVVLLLAIWAAYTLTRMAVNGDPHVAISHGRELLDIEARLHLAVEASLNGFVHQFVPLAVFSAYWYSSLHYVVTISVLVLVRRRRPGQYRARRDALIVTTIIGLIGFWLYPAAPPRLIPGTGFTDTMAELAQYGWWSGGQASAPRGVAQFTNEFAAMPSLHVAYAIWAGFAVFMLTRNCLVRTLAVVYPCVTSFVVIVTANHYLLDVVAGGVVVLFAVIAVWAVGRGPGPGDGSPDSAGQSISAAKMDLGSRSR